MMTTTKSKLTIELDDDTMKVLETCRGKVSVQWGRTVNESETIGIVLQEFVHRAELTELAPIGGPTRMDVH